MERKRSDYLAISEIVNIGVYVLTGYIHYSKSHRKVNSRSKSRHSLK